MHLAAQDLEAGLHRSYRQPVARGHIAYRTENIQAFMAHLDTRRAYSDWGDRVAGWHQIFFYDPDGNVIEVHQVEKAEDEKTNG